MRDHERTPAHALHRGHPLASAHGPAEPRTMPAEGAKKRAWFDVKHFPIKVTGDYCLTSTAQDAEGLERSIERVHALIRAEIAQGIPASRIVLGGCLIGTAALPLTLSRIAPVLQASLRGVLAPGW